MENDVLIHLLMENNEMWSGRAVSLVKALDGTGIDPASPALLDEMIVVRDQFPQVAAVLESLPGYASGHRSEAEKHLGYMTMQIVRVSSGYNKVGGKV